MNAKKILTAVALITLSLSAVAADFESVIVPAKQGKTRDEVKAELKLAIANGEIVHGDLADFQQLVANRQPERALVRTDKRESRAQDVAKARSDATKDETSL